MASRKRNKSIIRRQGMYNILTLLFAQSRDLRNLHKAVFSSGDFFCSKCNKYVEADGDSEFNIERKCKVFVETVHTMH